MPLSTERMQVIVEDVLLKRRSLLSTKAERKFRRSVVRDVKAIDGVVEIPAEWPLAEDEQDDYQVESIDTSTLEDKMFEPLWFKNCGTGSGGFKPGNVCATGGGSGQAQAKAPKPLAKTSTVSTDGWPAHNSAAQWGANKIAKMEHMAATGDWAGLKGIDAVPKTAKPNKYQQAVHDAHKKLLAGEATTNENPKAKAATGDVAAAISKPESVAAKTNAPSLQEALSASQDGKPVDIGGWEKTGGQLGSNNGSQMTGPDGTKYYVKFSGVQQAQNEVLAGKLYQATGSQTPTTFLVTRDGQTGLASVWDHGTKNVDFNNPAHMESVQKDFATHAWLANWDAAGMSFDNTKIDSSGNGTTVDVGGSMKYRAQGVSKGDAWNDAASEWASMRDATKNPNTSKLYGKMTPDQLANSAKKVAAISDEKIKSLVDKHADGSADDKAALTARLIARRDQIAIRAEANVHVTAFKEAKAQGLSNDKANEAANLAVEKLAIPNGPMAKQFQAAKKMKEEAAHQALTEKMVKAQEKLKAEKAAIEKSAALEAVNQVKENAVPVSHPDAKHEASPSTTMAPSLPPPPQTNTAKNPGVQKKLDAIYEAGVHASKTGDLSKLDAIATNGDAKQSYAKQAHKYKQQVMQAVSLGGKVDPAHKVGESPAVVKKLKVKESELPSEPEFISSNAANVAANKKAVAELKQHALNGDVDAIKAHPGTGSPKVTSYKEALAQSVHDQLNPPPPPKPLSDKIQGLSDAHKAKSPPHHAADRVWRFVSLGKANITDVGGDAGVVNTSGGKWKQDSKKLEDSALAAHKASYNKLPADQQDAIDKYIDGGYSTQNAVMAGDVKGTASQRKTAKLQIEGMKNGSVPIPEGTVLYRGHSLEVTAGSGSLMTSEQTKKALQSSAGVVLQDPAMISTARVAQSAWSGGAQWRLTAGPGVKGLAAPSQGEKEVILPPNTRYLVKSVQEHNGTLFIDAVILPTVDEQYDALPNA